VTERTRRELLAACCAAGGALVAGCSGESDTAPSQGESESTRSVTTDRTRGPVPAGEFAGSCPPYPNIDRVICWDAAREASVPGSLAPSSRKASPDSAVEFTLSNDSNAQLLTNPYNWYLHKYDGEEWFHVAPMSWPLEQISLDAGEKHSWTMTVRRDDVEDGRAVPRLRTRGEIALSGAGGGRYAFRARGQFADDSLNTTIAFGTTFEIDAGDLTLAPSTAIQNVAVDGNTVFAESTRGDPEEGYPAEMVYVLERLDPPVIDAQQLITEQVIRRIPLRGAVALAEAEDADRVEITERNGAVPAFAGTSPRTIEYQGSYYEVVVRETEA
jgi:hypothetical protein